MLATGLLLLVLAGTSFGLSFVRLGAWALPVALLIATLKALLVIHTFMELFEEAVSVRLTILAALVMLGLLASFTIADVLTRARPPLLPPSPSELSQP